MMNEQIPPTEAEHPAAGDLGKLGPEGVAKLMVTEEAESVKALKKVTSDIAALGNLGAEALKSGGRIIYAGAGTSGRIAAMDAAECVPTFGTSPDMVQFIMAGGPKALMESIENAEDDRTAGARAVRERGVTQKDLVIGISASGGTPFVLGVLDEAKKLGAKTGLVTASMPLIDTDVTVRTNTGPEIIAGSTRLKAGTTAKIVLNAVSTIAMVETGRTCGNLMICVQPTNEKLRRRSERMVARLTGITGKEVREALEESGWNVAVASVMVKHGIPLKDAENRLRAAGGSVEEALAP